MMGLMSNVTSVLKSDALFTAAIWRVTQCGQCVCVCVSVWVVGCIMRLRSLFMKKRFHCLTARLSNLPESTTFAPENLAFILSIDKRREWNKEIHSYWIYGFVAVLSLDESWEVVTWKSDVGCTVKKWSACLDCISSLLPTLVQITELLISVRFEMIQIKTKKCALIESDEVPNTISRKNMNILQTGKFWSICRNSISLVHFRTICFHGSDIRGGPSVLIFFCIRTFLCDSRYTKLQFYFWRTSSRVSERCRYWLPLLWCFNCALFFLTDKMWTYHFLIII